MEKAIVLVDAYSTGFEYLSFFQQHGFKIIHVQSNPDTENLGYFVSHQANVEKQLNATDINIIHSNTLDELISEIETATEQHKISGVLAGADTGVLLANTIANALKVDTADDKTLSKALRDKCAMQAELEKNNLNHIPTYRIQNTEELNSMDLKPTLTNPMVAKPVDSAGSDNVYFCHTKAEINAALETILGANNVLNGKNTEAVIQTCVTGQEYMVNTASYGGVHEVVELHEIHKQRVKQPDGRATIIYDWERIVEPDSKEDMENYEKIAHYTKQTLDALKIQHGAAHSEVMLQKNGEPVLIETAARPGGSVEIPLLHNIYGRSQPSVVADAFNDPATFKSRVKKSERPNKKAGSLYAIYLRSEKPYELQHDVGDTFLNYGKSIAGDRCVGQHLYLKKQGSQSIEATKDLVNCPGIIYFHCDSQKEFDAIYNAFRANEQACYETLAKPSDVNYATLFAHNPNPNAHGTRIVGLHV